MTARITREEAQELFDRSKREGIYGMIHQPHARKLAETVVALYDELAEGEEALAAEKAFHRLAMRELTVERRQVDDLRIALREAKANHERVLRIAEQEHEKDLTADNAAQAETNATLTEIAEHTADGWFVPDFGFGDPITHWARVEGDDWRGKPMSPRVAAWFEANKGGER